MFKKNYTTEILGLQDAKIENVCEIDDVLQIEVSIKRRKQKCPCCGRSTKKVHDYRLQRVKDVSFRDKKTEIILRKRRYLCPHCHKRFYEKNTWLPRYCRRTTRLTAGVTIKLKELVSCRHVANECNVSVTTVQRIFDVVDYSGKPLPEVLLIDEFKGNTGSKKYQCILMNGITGELIDILPNRDTGTLISYFKNKNTDTVRFLVSDMWKPYQELCLTVFKNARHIADKYHVVRQVTWAMEAIRKEVQKELNKHSRLRYKHTASILRKPYSMLTANETEHLMQILTTSPKLAKAYWLKESFSEVFRAKTYEEAIELLKEWIKKAASSCIDRYVSCSKTMAYWSKSIATAIQYGYTNGRIEGMNNKIKVLKRVSFGFRNFRRFRNRIFHTA